MCALPLPLEYPQKSASVAGANRVSEAAKPERWSHHESCLNHVCENHITKQILNLTCEILINARRHDQRLSDYTRKIEYYAFGRHP